VTTWKFSIWGSENRLIWSSERDDGLYPTEREAQAAGEVYADQLRRRKTGPLQSTQYSVTAEEYPAGPK
jgi:hypothetical protein